MNNEFLINSCFCKEKSYKVNKVYIAENIGLFFGKINHRRLSVSLVFIFFMVMKATIKPYRISFRTVYCTAAFITKYIVARRRCGKGG